MFKKVEEDDNYTRLIGSGSLSQFDRKCARIRIKTTV